MRNQEEYGDDSARGEYSPANGQSHPEFPGQTGPQGEPGQQRPPAVARQTNQAERAAMHPDGNELEWEYYHGAWGG